MYPVNLDFSYSQFYLEQEGDTVDRGVRHAQNLTDQRFESLQIPYNLPESSHNIEISVESLKSH